MAPKKYYTFMIDPDLADALKRAKAQERELSESAIIRLALRDWLEAHGIMKAERTRPVARKRPRR